VPVGGRLVAAVWPDHPETAAWLADCYERARSSSRFRASAAALEALHLRESW
jgi:hypothetical protein